MMYYYIVNLHGERKPYIPIFNEIFDDFNYFFVIRMDKKFSIAYNVEI